MSATLLALLAAFSSTAHATVTSGEARHQEISKIHNLDIRPLCYKGAPGFRVRNVGDDFSRRAVFTLKAARMATSLPSRSLRLKQGQSATFHAHEPRLPSTESVYLYMTRAGENSAPQPLARVMCAPQEHGLKNRG
ncbi:hypothetical protein [Varunaivibrio sulfuroxidans]|nr:hypothetical protein [Varunaivibrio sulfuroxidans]WES30535.1 hypothetical protein P3M64_12970 [Varunaivibrio sulfuroxidans]